MPNILNQREIPTLDDLYAYAEKQGILVEEYTLPLCKSVSVAFEDRYSIGIDPKRHDGTAEERTHLAHELGHCMTGAFYAPYEPRDLRGRREYQADRWAVHTLIPWQNLCKALKNGITERWELAEHFCVTEEMIDRAWFIYQTEGKAPV